MYALVLLTLVFMLMPHQLFSHCIHSQELPVTKWPLVARCMSSSGSGGSKDVFEVLHEAGLEELPGTTRAQVRARQVRCKVSLCFCVCSVQKLRVHKLTQSKHRLLIVHGAPRVLTAQAGQRTVGACLCCSMPRGSRHTMSYTLVPTYALSVAHWV